MNKDQKKLILLMIETLGFEMTFGGLDYTEFPAELAVLAKKYYDAQQDLSKYVGYPADLDLLEKETQM